MHKLDLTTAKWAQNRMETRERNAKANAYSKSVAKRRKAKRGDNALTIAMATLCISTFAWVALDAFEIKLQTANANANEVVAMETEQQYIVRYGYVDGFCDNGDMVIVTNDGNEWLMADAPCYNKGTEVRVLFDSNRTVEVTDDIIIDVITR